MKRVSVPASAAKTLRAAKEQVIVCDDGGEVLGRFVPVAAILNDSRVQARLVHFPHDPDECFGTCWRHSESGVAAGQ